MIIDKQLEFSDAQAITATAPSTNIIDTQVAGQAYEALWFVAQVATTMTGGTSVTVDLQTDDAAAFAAPKTLYSSGAVPVASLTAGAQLAKVRVPPGCKRYLRVNYTVAGGPFTAGAVDAFLVMDAQIGF